MHPDRYLAVTLASRPVRSRAQLVLLPSLADFLHYSILDLVRLGELQFFFGERVLGLTDF